MVDYSFVVWTGRCLDSSLKLLSVARKDTDWCRAGVGWVNFGACVRSGLSGALIYVSVGLVTPAVTMQSIDRPLGGAIAGHVTQPASWSAGLPHRRCVGSVPGGRAY